MKTLLNKKVKFNFLLFRVKSDSIYKTIIQTFLMINPKIDVFESIFQV